MIYILYGPDDYSLRQALSEIKKSVGIDALDSTNINQITGAAVNIADFQVACATIPFLTDKRLVIVEGLLGRFEPNKKPAPAKKSNRNKETNNEWLTFVDCMKNLPESTVLVLIDSELDKNNPLFREIEPIAEVMIFPLLRYNSIIDWIKKRISRSGARISTSAVELMAKLVGNDLWAMDNELEKLILFASGRMIEEKDVRALVSYAQETSVFAMVDAIMESKINAAQELLQQQLQNGATPAYLLTMLARQLRLAVLVKEMISQKKTKNEIQLKMGLADFALQKSMEQADKYSSDKLKLFYEKLLETDLAIKAGKYDEELALSILVVELCQR